MGWRVDVTTFAVLSTESTYPRTRPHLHFPSQCVARSSVVLSSFRFYLSLHILVPHYALRPCRQRSCSDCAVQRLQLVSELAEQHCACQELRIASRCNTVEHLQCVLAGNLLHLDPCPRSDSTCFVARRLVRVGRVC